MSEEDLKSSEKETAIEAVSDYITGNLKNPGPECNLRGSLDHFVNGSSLEETNVFLFPERRHIGNLDSSDAKPVMQTGGFKELQELAKGKGVDVSLKIGDGIIIVKLTK